MQEPFLSFRAKQGFVAGIGWELAMDLKGSSDATTPANQIWIARQEKCAYASIQVAHSVKQTRAVGRADFLRIFVSAHESLLTDPISNKDPGNGSHETPSQTQNLHNVDRALASRALYPFLCDFL
jgi:hypothetical protein